MTEPLTISAIVAACRSGALSPRDSIAAAYRRLAAHADPAACIHIVPEETALSQAEAHERRDPSELPLLGVPMVIKDNIDLADAPTTAACPGYATTPDRSAPVVRRLQAAGAVVIAKTNMDQFATGLVGTRSPYGTPRNPIDPTRIPGGSSSGSATLVSAGVVPLALGTDTAGSGRVPAGFNRIVGTKPTKGRLSTRGVVPAVRSLDCVSLFTLDVADARIALSVADDFDSSDPFARRPATPAPIAAPRIGTPDRVIGDDETIAAFETATDHLEYLTGATTGIGFGVLSECAELLYGGPWVAERTAAVGPAIAANIDGLDPTVSGIIAGGDRFSAVDAWKGTWRLAELQRQVEPIWDAIDVLAVPTTPGHPTLEQVANDPVAVNSWLGTYTNFCNLMDLCAVAVPGPERSDGLPAGVTFLAPAWHEATLLDLAARFHNRCGVGCGAINLQPAPA